jgi:hypothetical protein
MDAASQLNKNISDLANEISSMAPGLRSTASSDLAASASATAAATSETNAAASASAAAASATNAGNSATSASNYAGTATTAATQAQSYASGAYTSETNAGNSATAAAGSATAAATSAGNAATSASQALTNASSAATAASTASLAATNAATAAQTAIAAMSTLRRGFRWFPNGNAGSGQSDGVLYATGTCTYHGIATGGTDFQSNSEYHSFVSNTGTYNTGGMQSNEPAVRMASGNFGGFIYESIFNFAFVPGTCGRFGVTTNGTDGYSNFGGTRTGVVVGWNDDALGSSPFQLMSADGTNDTITAATVGTLADAGTYALRIESRSTGCLVTLKNLDTGVVIFNKQPVTTTLPPNTEALYGAALVGTLATTGNVSMNLFAMSTVPLPILY